MLCFPSPSCSAACSPEKENLAQYRAVEGEFVDPYPKIVRIFNQFLTRIERPEVHVFFTGGNLTKQGYMAWWLFFAYVDASSALLRRVWKDSRCSRFLIWERKKEKMVQSSVWLNSVLHFQIHPWYWLWVPCFDQLSFLTSEVVSGHRAFLLGTSRDMTL